MIKMNAKPVSFDFNKYLSGGIDLYKNNFGNILIAYLFCFVMNIIPFCGLLGIGNLYRYLHKLRKGEQVSPGEIFDFNDFVPYFVLQLILFAAFTIAYFPMLFLTLFMTNGEDPSPVFFIFFFPYMFALIIAIIIVTLKGFYMPALISIAGIKDLKTAWNMSRVMTKNNLLSIFLLIFVAGILAQLGILLCGIGIFLTIPVIYTSNYMAFEDALNQIQNDEITEIGLKNEY